MTQLFRRVERYIWSNFFRCLVMYLSKIIWFPITSSGRFDVCLFRHISSLIPNSDHLFCRRYFLPIGRATVWHMTDMLPKSHNIHPHPHTHFHDQSETQIYPSEDTPEVKNSALPHLLLSTIGFQILPRRKILFFSETFFCLSCLSWRFWSQSLKLLNLPP